MQIKLSDHFTYRKLLRFTLSSVVMMVFTSVYSVVDGLFVSNLVGDLALSAVNIMFPLAMIVGAFGFMLGTGGSAIVARTLGEGQPALASRYFSMIIYAVILLGAVLTAGCLLFLEPLARLAGASDLLLHDCLVYGGILLGGSVPFMLQTTLQSFFVVAEKPHLGLFLSIAAGATNMVFDYILIAVCGLGVAGAAIATVLGYLVGGVLPLLYFLRPGRDGLRLTRTRLYGRELLQACVNGSSELMSNISSSFVGILYNIQLMRLIGELGVAAYSVMMYVDFVFIAAFLGFSLGSAPIISFHYGADNHAELKNVFRKSMAVIGVTSCAMVLLSEVLSRPLSAAFVGYHPELLELTVHGFRLFALCYLFSGINIYASAFFTALCNGGLSALISFLRTLLLRGGMVLLMPLLFGLDGIWTAVIAAEGIGAVISLALLWYKRKTYHYG
ncbi:MATE family efflux transporter [Agathobaculum desmolans]|uniref:MATE family efflux transporter n=1 Tax=Agathobaculum desmolans TaxID=39484 RepID=UPI0004E21E65|nr:MATE family efflux transporter [Agathobaculum desmolans]